MRTTSAFDRLPARLRPQTAVRVGVLEWRPVPDYPDYEISTFGLVRRVRASGAHRAGRVLRPSLSDGIYPTVELYRDGVGRTERVHLLLARAFVREPRPGEVVRHLDGRPQVPTAWTVGYGDDADNARDRREHARSAPLAGPSPAVLAAACATLDMLLLGATMREAAARWGVSPSKAAKLRRGRRHGAELELLFSAVARVLEGRGGASPRAGAPRRRREPEACMVVSRGSRKVASAGLAAGYVRGG